MASQTLPHAGLTRHGECKQVGDGTWSCWPRNAGDAKVPAGAEVDRELEIFRITVEHFRHDLVALWNHATYFSLIQGALFTVFITVIGRPNAGGAPGLVSSTQEALFLAAVGLVFGLFWSWVSWRRIKLISLWRHNVTHLDGRVDRHGVYLRVEPSVAAHWWYGPSAFTARLPWLICTIWVFATIWLVLFT
jgi:hypothetical protein